MHYVARAFFLCYADLMTYIKHVRTLLEREHVDINDIVSSLSIATATIVIAFVASIFFPSLGPILAIALFLLAFPVMFIALLLGYSIVSWIIHRKD